MATLRRAVPTLFAAWLATLYLVTTPPYGMFWPDPQDLPGYALMIWIIAPRLHVVFARPGAYVILALVLWLCVRTPDISNNTQVGHVLLAATAAFTGLVAPRKIVRRFHGLLIVGGALSMVLTCGAWAIGKGLLLSGLWNSGDPFNYGTWNRWAGTTPHPNLFAYLGAITLWAAMTWRWRGRRWEMAAMALVGSLMGAALFATLSRTGWLLFWGTAALGGGGLLDRARRGGIATRRLLPAMLLVATAAASFAGSLAARPDLFTARMDTVHRQVSPTPGEFRGNAELDITSRGNVYPDAWGLILKAPWTGYGMAGYLRMGRYPAIHSHQLVLELLLCGGLPALALALGAFGWAFFRGQGSFLRGMIALALVAGLADCFVFFKWPLVWLAFSAGAAIRCAPTGGFAPRVGTFARRHAPLVLFFAVLAVVYQLREEFSIDFHAYYGAMRWSAETGEPPYQAWNGNVYDMGNDALTRYLREHQTESLNAALRFLYPPSAFAQLRAFTWIEDPALAARLWRLFNLAMLAGCIGLAARLLPQRARSGSALLLALLVASSSPVRDTLWLGQVSIWVSLLMLVYLRGLECRRPVLAGAALGIAAALKIYPAFWLLTLLLYPGRRGRAALGFGVALGLMVAVSLLTDGAGVWRAYWENVASKIGDAPPPGGVTFFPFVDNLWVNRALLLAVFAGCAVYSWRMRTAGLARKRLAFLVITAALFLALPLVWAHYLVLVEILLAVLCISLFNVRSAPGFLAYGAAGAYLLSAHAWPVHQLLGVYRAWPLRVGLLLVVLLPVLAAHAHKRRCIPPTAPI